MLESDMQLTVGAQPPAVTVPSLPKLESLGGADGQFRIVVPVAATYDSLSKLLMEELGNRWVPVRQDVKVKLRGIEFSPSGGRLIITANVCADGPSSWLDSCGKAYLWGRPLYDPAARAVRVVDVDYDIETRNAIAKTAEWLLHTALLERLREKIVFPVGDKLDEARVQVTKVLAGVTVGDHLALSGTLREISVDGIYVGGDRLLVRGTAIGSLAGRVSLKK